MSLPNNNLIHRAPKSSICKMFGIKMVSSTSIILVARVAGYDSVFIDLEASSFSLTTSAELCSASLLAGITPFVRVPHQCGSGFVQRVLDGGAMGIVFPHVDNAAEALAAVASLKYPPLGKRSLTGALPHYAFNSVPVTQLITELNFSGSTAIIMIETAAGVENVDAIAQVPGVDVLFVGVNDLALALGVSGQWNHPIFSNAVENISQAAEKAGKLWGFGGLYGQPEVSARLIVSLGARLILGAMDAGLLADGMNCNIAELNQQAVGAV